MKKEKTVKTYQRRTKTGKVVTVRQHTAKYDAADKAAEASKKKGSGDELESLKKSKTMDTPVEISKDDFKEWYNFNEWDTPKKEWPESVKKVDSHLRKTMGKKGYDDYCAKIDESWSARGHIKAFKSFGSPAASATKVTSTAKKTDKPTTAKSTQKSEPRTFTEIPKTSRSIKEGTYDVGNGYSVKVRIDNLGDSKKPVLVHRAKLYKDGKEVSANENSYNEVSGTAKGVHNYLKKVQGWGADEAKRTKRNEANAKRQATLAAKATKSAESKTNGSLTKNSITKALNNAGFKNDISSIKVDNDSVSIRLEGKAYGSGYSSYVEYNPSRPKSGYEVEGNPKRAEHVYEALRKLKGIDKLKSLVITESYD